MAGEEEFDDLGFAIGMGNLETEGEEVTVRLLPRVSMALDIAMASSGMPYDELVNAAVWMLTMALELPTHQEGEPEFLGGTMEFDDFSIVYFKDGATT